MNSLKALLVVFSIFILGSASVALAGKQDFTLENQTGYQIEQVYVSSVNTDDWEEDVLGRRYLSDGQ